ncbi:hypothetical protein Tco_0706598 [Tanacetum coccineum]|uniref:Uncharacterized protein n=1 Tax=Tanacetum coccineum TaxID=301880 RepID=A0ABQ4Y8T3_9ASTR
MRRRPLWNYRKMIVIVDRLSNCLVVGEWTRQYLGDSCEGKVKPKRSQQSFISFFYLDTCVIIERCSLGSSVNFSRIDLRIWLSSIKRVHEEDIPKTAFRTWPEVAHGVKGRERDSKNAAWPGPTNGKEGREGADKTYYDLRDMYGGHVWRMISTYVSNCLTCLKVNAETSKTFGFPRSSSGYVTNWVIVDRLTKECSIDQSVRGGDLLLSAWNRHCRRH